MQDNYPAEQSVESSERRQDTSELELENLLMKERQLQVLSKIFQMFENNSVKIFGLSLCHKEPAKGKKCP